MAFLAWPSELGAPGDSLRSPPGGSRGLWVGVGIGPWMETRASQIIAQVQQPCGVAHFCVSLPQPPRPLHHPSLPQTSAMPPESPDPQYRVLPLGTAAPALEGWPRAPGSTLWG